MIPTICNFLLRGKPTQSKMLRTTALSRHVSNTCHSSPDPALQVLQMDFHTHTISTVPHNKPVRLVGLLPFCRWRNQSIKTLTRVAWELGSPEYNLILPSSASLSSNLFSRQRHQTQTQGMTVFSMWIHGRLSPNKSPCELFFFFCFLLETKDDESWLHLLGCNDPCFIISLFEQGLPISAKPHEMGLGTCKVLGKF